MGKSPSLSLFFPTIVSLLVNPLLPKQPPRGQPVTLPVARAVTSYAELPASRRLVSFAPERGSHPAPSPELFQHEGLIPPAAWRLTGASRTRRYRGPLLRDRSPPSPRLERVSNVGQRVSPPYQDHLSNARW